MIEKNVVIYWQLVWYVLYLDFKLGFFPQILSYEWFMTITNGIPIHHDQKWWKAHETARTYISYLSMLPCVLHVPEGVPYQENSFYITPLLQGSPSPTLLALVYNFRICLSCYHELRTQARQPTKLNGEPTGEPTTKQQSIRWQPAHKPTYQAQQNPLRDSDFSCCSCNTCATIIALCFS